LIGVYPNPFNSRLSVEVEVPQKDFVELSIYDLNGKKVKDIFNGTLNKGIHLYTVDFQGYHSGQYFVKMKSENFSKTKKVVLVK